MRQVKCGIQAQWIQVLIGGSMKTYPTKTQATKAKKFGQTTRKRKDGTWVCEWPKSKKK